MHECNFGRIAYAMEHAFAEEHAAERDAVETADKHPTVVNFDAVAMTAVVQLAIEITDAVIDPGALAAVLRLGAAVDYALEVAVNRDRESVGAHRAGEPGRDMEAVKRNDAALFRLDPIERRVLGAFGHWKDAAGIGLQ